MTEIIMVLIPVLIVALFILYTWNLLKMNREKKAGLTIKDERTIQIEGKAARITVHGTSYFMLALMWYVFATNIFELGLPVLETGWALILSVLFNSLFYAGMIFYFRKKGD